MRTFRLSPGGRNSIKLRGETATAFNRELWVADKGLYRDGKLKPLPAAAVAGSPK